jgi:putative transposase
LRARGSTSGSTRRSRTGRSPDWLLTEQIRAIYERSDETYGSPRVHAELLLDHGVRVSNKRVARLMRQHGFRSV